MAGLARLEMIDRVCACEKIGIQNNEQTKTNNLKREDIVPPVNSALRKPLITIRYRRFVGGSLPDCDVFELEKNCEGLNKKNKKIQVIGNKAGGTGVE
jgi:hypothetical protein